MQFSGAVGEVSADARQHRNFLAIRLRADRLCRVLVLFLGITPPVADCRETSVSGSLVLHNGRVAECADQRVLVTCPVGIEVGL